MAAHVLAAMRSRWRPIALGTAAAVVTVLTACSSMAKMAYLEALPLTGFQTHARDPRVHYEPGAEVAAESVASILDVAVRQIETSHGEALRKRPSVYLCATAACWQRYAFVNQARAETRPFSSTVLLQGHLLVEEHRLQAILTHELSHAFWFERSIRCHPRWWTEGLAVHASGGGGAEMVSIEEAVAAVREGRLFTEIDESCYVRDSAPRVGLTWPMFYRQAGMFVGWLQRRDGAAFERALSDLRKGQSLMQALESSYAAPPAALWQHWRSEVETSDARSLYLVSPNQRSVSP